jgi:protein-S-isoprenylcysteine O-methyltransferase Ste14
MSVLSTSGRLAPPPFALAVLVVYLVSFGSQVLLSPPVTRWAGVWAFTLVQAILIWLWIVLHGKRLRDAGRPIGLAIGVACVYALEIVLLVMMVWLLLSAGLNKPDEAAGEASILQLFVILYLLAQLTGDPTLGGLEIWIMGFVVLMVLPVAIALGFSIWAGTRPSVAGPSPSPP